MSGSRPLREGPRSEESDTAIVVDLEEAPSMAKGRVLSWRCYAEGPGVTSIPRHVDTHAERLRARYIAFAYEIGESRIAGKRVVDHLKVGTGPSFWWMSKLAEKSPFKSSRIFDCIRMLALEEMLLERRPRAVELHSADAVLAQATRQLCSNLLLDFVWIRPPRRTRRLSARRLYHALPYPLQGLASLRHLRLRWRVRRLEKPRWFTGPRAIFVCSYFAHLDAQACGEGRFHSYQWEALPALLRRLDLRSNWIHHFLHRPTDVSAGTGLKWMQRFNQEGGSQGHHAYLESYLSWKVVLRALRSWVRLNAAAWRLRKIGAWFRPPASGVSLWPLLEADWRDSICGATAVDNCIWAELFDVALARMPTQEKGLYLWENQAWECALVHAWRRHGHGTIIGVPHSTVPFWYLNIYDDARAFDSAGANAKPVPDFLAVNGRMARNALTRAGCQPGRLIDVEALRFQHLITTRPGTGGEWYPPRRADPAPEHAPRKLLVLGDYALKQTLKMLKCVHLATRLHGVRLAVTLKAHPNCTIEESDLPSEDFTLTTRPLGEMVREFDFAFCSNSTSAGLECLLAGLPVAVFLDDEDFNHSPLRGVAGVQFADGAAKLASFLDDARRMTAAPAVEEFFWVDEKLSRWSELLAKPAPARVNRT